MDRVIRNGKVAVLYSPGYGAGWYSWHGNEDLLFDPDVVAMVEAGRDSEIEEFVQAKYNDGTSNFYLCTIAAGQLRIKWLPSGTRFRVHAYDGYESVEEFD